MRKLIPVILLLLLSSLIVIGSSGTFVYFNAEREVKVAVVDHDEEYLSFMCYDGYAATVIVDQNSELTFDALTVGNYLNELETVDIWLDPDYSNLPSGVDMWIESEDGVTRPVNSQEYYTFSGNISVGNADPGTYEAPITLYATWEGGDAVVETCPIKVIILSGPKIRKILLSGNTTNIPLKTYQEWVFQIEVNNSGTPRNLTIKDTIPAEFDVLSVSESAGNATYAPAGGGQAATKLEWSVELGAGESTHLNVTIATRLSPSGKFYAFTSCDTYDLNEGAEIVGYGIVSNKLTVEANIGCEDDEENGSSHGRG
ncbi:DUF11 domain-containing protein [Thermococcus litoralis]|uniref:DUF11 domain-containing protein n=1 Tax=Thermococcus litoralis TaxID=2265 RepID=UPI0015C50B6A|nr:DUF11 domain-containing protein [Thermococcus litoralis]